MNAKDAKNTACHHDMCAHAESIARPTRHWCSLGPCRLALPLSRTVSILVNMADMAMAGAASSRVPQQGRAVRCTLHTTTACGSLSPCALHPRPRPHPHPHPHPTASSMRGSSPRYYYHTSTQPPPNVTRLHQPAWLPGPRHNRHTRRAPCPVLHLPMHTHTAPSLPRNQPSRNDKQLPPKTNHVTR